MAIIWLLTCRELRARFRGAWLGQFWWLAQPLLSIFLYTVVFSSVMRTRLPGSDNSLSYVLYVCAGVFLWTLFSDIVGRGKVVLLENAFLIRKMALPLPILMVPVLLIGLLNFFILLGLLQLVLWFWQSWTLSWADILLPTAICLFFAVGLALVLAQLNVFIRDIGPITDIALQLGFWITPIIYQVEHLPMWAQQLMVYHPLASIWYRMQAAFLHTDIQNQGDLWYPCMGVLGLWLLASFLYYRTKIYILDEI